MSVYRFKVIIEDYEDLFREIEVKASQSFEDLHFAILKAFGFDLKHPASFFYSDDLWHMAFHSGKSGHRLRYSLRRFFQREIEDICI